MKLFYYPWAPYTRKVLLAAFEKESVFEPVLTSPFDKTAKAALKAAHPLATIPLLVLDSDEPMTESVIIVEHFDLGSDRGPKLLPTDPRAALVVRALDRFIDSHLMSPTQYLAFATRKPVEQQNTEKIRAQRNTVETAIGLMDARLGKHPFLAGEEIRMADLSLTASIACQLLDGTQSSLERWPNLTRWFKTMIARPSFKRVVEECSRVPPPGLDPQLVQREVDGLVP